MKKIFLENLPHSISGNSIKWRDSIGCNIHFIFEDIEGDFKIIDYGNFTSCKQKEIKIQYGNKIKTITTGNLVKMRFSDIFENNIKDYVNDDIKNYKNNKFINLSILPSNYRGIDWNEASRQKCKLRFKYGEIEGILKILSYHNNFVTVKYNDVIYKLRTENIRNCALGKILDVIKREYRFNIGEIIKDDYRNFTLIDRYIKHFKKNSQKFYKYKCNICGYVGEIYEGNITNKKQNCSCCAGKVVVEGINDIPTTAPWMAPYFQGGYDEAKQYSYGSEKKIYPKCPNCNTISNKLVQINYIHNNKNGFCNCGDGKSYPEKFVYNFLRQLTNSEDIISQYNHSQATWITNNYRYDYYIKSKNIIIEVHGNQHYSENTFQYCGGLTLDGVKRIDELKRKLAFENNISHYVVIDCRKSNMKWIKNSLINSCLLDIFSNSKEQINWDSCEENARSNLTKQVCDYKNNHEEATSDEICNYFGISKNTFCRYIRIGESLGWCSKIIFTKNEKPICLIDKNMFFKNINQFCNLSKQILGYYIPPSSVRYHCVNNKPTNKGILFKYITKKEYIAHVKNNGLIIRNLQRTEKFED